MAYSVKSNSLTRSETNSKVSNLINSIPPCDSPLKDEIYMWLKEGGAIPESIEVEDETGVSWRVRTDDGLAVMARLYNWPGDPACYVWFEVALAVLPNEIAGNVIQEASRWAYELPLPFRVSLAPANILVLQYRGLASTVDDPKFHLDLMLSVARDLVATLNKEFDLKPFRQPRSDI